MTNIYYIMKTKTFLLGLSAVFLSSLALLSCSDDENKIENGDKATPNLGAVTVDELSITHNAATVTAELIDWGEAEPNSAGICWATTTNPTVQQQTKVKIDMSEPGTYEYNIEGLLPETKYYVRSFARNARGLVYSEQLEFETKPESPDMMDYVKVGNPELIGEPGKVNANIASEIISDGGGTLKRVGFVVSDHTQPTVDDKVYELSPAKTGKFELSISSLLSSTTYYVRTFGENAKGVVYSDDELSFTTQEADMSLRGNCGNLLIGGTVEVPLGTPGDLNDKAEKIIEREYNVVQIPCYPIAWNSWSALEDMNLDAQSQYVDWCKERGIKVIGHFLLAGPQSYYPEWFLNKIWSNDELEKALEDRIKTVIEKMGADKVDMWTVVNESMNKGIYETCKWSALGTEPSLAGGKDVPIYITKAFEYAKKYAPNAELILSERNFLMSMQTDKNAVEFRKLAQHLKAKGLCTTVGVQLHQIQAKAGFENPETMAGWAQLTNHVKWFKDNGFKIIINEVSISKSKTQSDPPFTATELDLQKRAYVKFMQTAIDAGADGMLFWGLGDGYNTYRQWDECTLYDHNRDRKPAFDGVLEVLMQKFPATE